jgi:hypothetical protein
MKLSEAGELPVVECLPYGKGPAGFALALLGHPESATLRAVQVVDELHGTVGGFATLEDDGWKGIQVSQVKISTVGRDVVHVFLTEDAVPHVGTLDELKPILMSFTQRYPEKVAIKLQIYELVGGYEQSRSARVAVGQTIAASVGFSAAQEFYGGSALRLSLWKRVLGDALNAEAAKRILRVRSRLTTRLSDGQIKLDLTALDPKDRSHIDEEKLVAELKAEFMQPVEDGGPDLTPTGVDLTPRQQETVHEVRVINMTGRLEERVAFLLQTILEDREVGMAALFKYQSDRAKFANWCGP